MALIHLDEGERVAASIQTLEDGTSYTELKVGGDLVITCGHDTALALAAEITRVHRTHQDGAIRR